MPTEQISLRLSKELLSAINRAAKTQMRTRTNMIEFILTDWMRENFPQELSDDFMQDPLKTRDENYVDEYLHTERNPPEE